jgi:Domain of unknown function (DUF2017)
VATARLSVVRLPDGSILLRMTPNERAILRALVDDLRAIVGDETPTPGLWEADDTPPAEVPDGDAAGDGEPSSDWARADPVIARLYPDVRPDDPAWSAGFRDLVRGDLDDGRREQIATVVLTLDARTIDDVEAEAWLHVLNDLRLVLGTRLGVVEDGDDGSFDPEDADAAAKVVYAYTAFLEAQFIDVLAEALPDVPDEGAPAADPHEGLDPDDS